MELPEFSPGLSARMELTVTDADTAQALGSGDVPVLGTPRVLALAEAATVGRDGPADARRCDHGRHPGRDRASGADAARPDGHRAGHADQGRRGEKLTFEVAVRDGDDLVAEVLVERVMLDRQRFIARAMGD